MDVLILMLVEVTFVGKDSPQSKPQLFIKDFYATAFKSYRSTSMMYYLKMIRISWFVLEDTESYHKSQRNTFSGNV